MWCGWVCLWCWCLGFFLVSDYGGIKGQWGPGASPGTYRVGRWMLGLEHPSPEIGAQSLSKFCPGFQADEKKWDIGRKLEKPQRSALVKAALIKRTP